MRFGLQCWRNARTGEAHAGKLRTPADTRNDEQQPASERAIIGRRANRREDQGHDLSEFELSIKWNGNLSTYRETDAIGNQNDAGHGFSAAAPWHDALSRGSVCAARGSWPVDWVEPSGESERLEERHRIAIGPNTLTTSINTINIE